MNFEFDRRLNKKEVAVLTTIAIFVVFVVPISIYFIQKRVQNNSRQVANNLPKLAFSQGVPITFGPENQITKNPATTKNYPQAAAASTNTTLIALQEQNQLVLLRIPGNSFTANRITLPSQEFNYPDHPKVIFDQNQFLAYFHGYRPGEMPIIWFLPVSQEGTAQGYQTIPISPSRGTYRQFYPSLATTKYDKVFIWQEDSQSQPDNYYLWAQKYNSQWQPAGENKKLEFDNLTLQHPKIVFNPRRQTYLVGGIHAYISGSTHDDLYVREFGRNLNPVGPVTFISEKAYAGGGPRYQLFTSLAGDYWIAYCKDIAPRSLWLKKFQSDSAPINIIAESGRFINSIVVSKQSGSRLFTLLWMEQSSSNSKDQIFFTAVFDPNNPQPPTAKTSLPSSLARQRYADLAGNRVFWEGVYPENTSDIFGASFSY